MPQLCLKSRTISSIETLVLRQLLRHLDMGVLVPQRDLWGLSHNFSSATAELKTTSPDLARRAIGTPTQGKPSPRGTTGTPKIVQQPATHGAPEPQPLDPPPASTADEGTSNTAPSPT